MHFGYTTCIYHIFQEIYKLSNLRRMDSMKAFKGLTEHYLIPYKLE